MGLSPIGIIGFGMLSDTSLMRVPRPPQKRTVFISAALSRRCGMSARGHLKSYLWEGLNLRPARWMHSFLSVAVYRVKQPLRVLPLEGVHPTGSVPTLRGLNLRSVAYEVPRMVDRRTEGPGQLGQTPI